MGRGSPTSKFAASARREVARQSLTALQWAKGNGQGGTGLRARGQRARHGRAFGTSRGSSFARCGSDELRAWFCALALVFDALRGFLDRCRLELVRAQCSHSFDLLSTSTPFVVYSYLTKKGVDGHRETGKKIFYSSYSFLRSIVLVAPAGCMLRIIGKYFFDSVQPLLALSEQRAWCTFFSLLLSASLLRCGLMVPTPEP